MGLFGELKVPDRQGVLSIPITDAEVLRLKRVYEEFDFTPVEGDLSTRATALLGYVEAQVGAGVHGAIHVSQAKVLSVKYGVDAVQIMFNDGVFTGV